MRRMTQTFVRAVVAALLCAMLIAPINCDVQNPPGNARTYWGVSLALP